MATYTLTIAKSASSKNFNGNGSFTTPFIASISPDVNPDLVWFRESSIDITVTVGISWVAGNRTIEYTGVSIKSADTTYATNNTSFTLYVNNSIGKSRSVQLSITDPNTFLRDLSTKTIFVEVSFHIIGGHSSWTQTLSVNPTSTTLTTLVLSASTPKQTCGQYYPTFTLSCTSNDTSGELQYQWLYSEQELDTWSSISSSAPTLNYTWVIDDTLSKDKTYDVVLECTGTGVRSNVVSIILYSPPSIEGVSVTPEFGDQTYEIELSATSIVDPAQGKCPLQYQWQYNADSSNEWLPLEDATNVLYRGQFTATTPETQFRLQVIGAGGAGHSDPVTYTAYYPTFPLNVEIGSPQYSTVSQINYSAGAIASVQVTPATSGTTPVSNSYYTFQSQDGQHWMTGFVGKWTNNGGTWTADLKWSSSNTDSLPAQSICWCVWTKEYYQSIIDRLSS